LIGRRKGRAVVPDDLLAEVELALSELIERHRSVCLEIAQLRRVNQELAEESERLKKEIGLKDQLLESAEQERLEIGKRLQRIRDHLKTLEQPLQQ